MLIICALVGILNEDLFHYIEIIMEDSRFAQNKGNLNNERSSSAEFVRAAVGCLSTAAVVLPGIWYVVDCHWYLAICRRRVT